MARIRCIVVLVHCNSCSRSLDTTSIAILAPRAPSVGRLAVREAGWTRSRPPQGEWCGEKSRSRPHRRCSQTPLGEVVPDAQQELQGGGSVRHARRRGLSASPTGAPDASSNLASSDSRRGIRALRICGPGGRFGSPPGRVPGFAVGRRLGGRRAAGAPPGNHFRSAHCLSSHRNDRGAIVPTGMEGTPSSLQRTPRVRSVTRERAFFTWLIARKKWLIAVLALLLAGLLFAAVRDALRQLRYEDVINAIQSHRPAPAAAGAAGDRGEFRRADGIRPMRPALRRARACRAA